MQAIPGFENVQAVHGRTSTRIPGGAYVMRIVRAKEDLTGYGNMCLKVVYDVLEGEYAGLFADIEGDLEQDWKHTVEIDCQEAQGGRLRTLVEALQASNPGYVWDWNEAALAGKVVGLVLQERRTTVTKGKNKGKDRTYLDFWDAVPVDAVRAGTVEAPPVNDQRKPKEDKPKVQAVPPTFGAQPQPAQVQAPVAPQQPMPPQYQQPIQAPAMPQQPMQVPQYQQPMPQQQQMQAPQYQQPMQADVSVYDKDIPF